ncbi:Coenzyme F420 hydrogenase/dehydrogenase, beta subunit C-terminal domain [Providencia burhodogranariea]|uniref:4Fe-4S ferredoxin n=1 Tax=Providencia burhodogranariea DSM 19968 TaxID=1141662 RepID=K8W102_9GAMM|nr:Coenzyme F420 hydrogenase/dehydrogenase, beta subunit C-terminal domain [Providencia burhodogranariea]EKT54124.1 4Fe-4S ferredoxin [Providencia burhodogranariea DSM 19968]
MSCSKIIDSVVKKDLCTGCGLCASACSSKSLRMKLNEYGFYTPVKIKECKDDCTCINVCPFNPNPESVVKTENEIADLFLKENTHEHPKIGHYIGLYAGHSIKHRLTSSSGGIATYLLTELLRKGIIQHVISVKESESDNLHYEYSISSSEEQLNAAAKTKYYPVTLENVLKKIQELEGNFAIVGVACFIKGIRLAQYYDPTLKQKIKFLIGIICGGIKSTFFAEYLASKASASPLEYKKPDFRVKDINSTAHNYAFSCIDKTGEQKIIKMWKVGDMWGTGLFKANACDFCDDVTTELADISLGDAWLEPYSNDGKGTNVIVTRSILAENLLQDGVLKNELDISILPQEQFLASQQGSYNHRHAGLLYRKNKALSKGVNVPPKRFDNSNISLLLKLIQQMRMITRKRSLEIWAEQKDSFVFDKKMYNNLFILRKLTRLNHIQRGIIKRIKKVIS